MDTNNQSTASRAAASFNPANIETNQESTSLNRRSSTAGRPVAIVAPQASVKADTSFQEVSEPQQHMRVATPSTRDQAYLPRQRTPEATTRTIASDQSASIEEPVMGSPASLSDAEQLQSLTNWMSDLYLEQSNYESSYYTIGVEEPVMDNPASLNDAKQSLSQLTNLVTNFYRGPSEDKFRQIEKLADQSFDQLFDKEGGWKHKLPFVIALISEKNNWPIQSSKCGELASEILEGRSRRAKRINSDVVSTEKLDFWWLGFFVTGEEKYLVKILKVIGGVLRQQGTLADKATTKAAAKWSFKENCEEHQVVKDFALRMKSDSSLSAHQRAYLRSITDATK
ncbi:hypothetical protein [Endozoicomonas sp. SCSIO W0465]|uniref:hypothetical protein n=1 Tax=Endozoicomonas sp. SCSIO W0465 TaxID=2918516 RepID=UPI002075BF9C|nr:hypothetical protein [Endozoicomonas sp. SCSIO W0465]USE36683.1 hypothetical protein MJO57_00065 [Endozoicomonas sp. SCSIO W0465]